MPQRAQFDNGNWDDLIFMWGDTLPIYLWLKEEYQATHVMLDERPDGSATQHAWSWYPGDEVIDGVHVAEILRTTFGYTVVEEPDDLAEHMPGVD